MEEMAQQEFVNLCYLTCPQARDLGELKERHPTACCDSNFRHKNRYPDVLAIEETRVKLGSCNGTDYINANFIDVETLGSSSHTRFISTQAPLPSTFGDFWQMVWEQSVSVICSLNKLLEKGRVKGDSYWPTSRPECYGPVTVIPNGVTKLSETGVILRKFKVIHNTSSDSREVIQLHYRAWPDFGVPKSTRGLRELVHLVKFYSDSARTKGIEGPVVVHCSAGIGRTGTFLAAFAIIESQQFQSLVNNPEFSGFIRQAAEVCDDEMKGVDWCSLLSQFKVPEVVLELRRQRNRGVVRSKQIRVLLINKVQTEPQYAFIYQVLMDEILTASGDQQRLPYSVQEIIRQELTNKLEIQLQEEEEKTDDRSATESEDEFNRLECLLDEDACFRSSSSSCLRRSRNTRWSPIGSPLVRSPARSPKNSRSFLTSSAPIGIQPCRSPRTSISPEPSGPNSYMSGASSFVSGSTSDSTLLRVPSSSVPETNRPFNRPTSPRPRRKELFTELDLEAVHASTIDCYSPKRSFLAQTVQF